MADYATQNDLNGQKVSARLKTANSQIVPRPAPPTPFSIQPTKPESRMLRSINKREKRAEQKNAAYFQAQAENHIKFSRNERRQISRCCLIFKAKRVKWEKEMERETERESVAVVLLCACVRCLLSATRRMRNLRLACEKSAIKKPSA